MTGPGARRWSELRSALEAEGFRPTKSLGQNFLKDPNLAAALVADSGVRPGELVLEVGPGLGFLSVPLLELGVRLVAVEVDRRLARILDPVFGRHPGARLVVRDVLASKHAIAPEVEAELPESGPWSVVANLPYSVSGPLLGTLARLGNPPRRISALVQAELCERITAGPGGRAWGALSARLAPVFTARAGRSVAAEMFWPRPRVESRVVHLERRAEHPPREALRAYDLLVEGLFQRRRKSLRAALRSFLGERPGLEEELRRLELDPGARPGELGLEELLRLSDSSILTEPGAGAGPPGPPGPSGPRGGR